MDDLHAGSENKNRPIAQLVYLFVLGYCKLKKNAMGLDDQMKVLKHHELKSSNSHNITNPKTSTPLEILPRASSYRSK